ncbi:MAG: hypothetical protein K8T25_10030 [Planctomycetia bacterium]|nr:hypothetical protein [Planctomycetia bacterium]
MYTAIPNNIAQMPIKISHKPNRARRNSGEFLLSHSAPGDTGATTSGTTVGFVNSAI